MSNVWLTAIGLALGVLGIREYYFGQALSSYAQDDAGNAALLAAISKSPRDYAPVPGNGRPIARRNQILALMARCRGGSAAPDGPRGITVAPAARFPTAIASRDQPVNPVRKRLFKKAPSEALTRFGRGGVPTSPTS